MLRNPCIAALKISRSFSEELVHEKEHCQTESTISILWKVIEARRLLCMCCVMCLQDNLFPNDCENRCSSQHPLQYCFCVISSSEVIYSLSIALRYGLCYYISLSHSWAPRVFGSHTFLFLCEVSLVTDRSVICLLKFKSVLKREQDYFSLGKCGNSQSSGSL